MLNYGIILAPRANPDLSKVLPVQVPVEKDGTVVFTEPVDKYAGMVANSFSISSQLEAGVSLRPSPAIDFNSQDVNDRLSKSAASIINSFNAE